MFLCGTVELFCFLFVGREEGGRTLCMTGTCTCTYMMKKLRNIFRQP